MGHHAWRREARGRCGRGMCAADSRIPQLIILCLTFIRKDFDVANTKIGQITIDYRGETQQFSTVSLAAHFLRQDRIKVGWFHKIAAAVELIGHDQVRQTQHLKGNKFEILQGLAQLDGAMQRSNA